MRLVAPHVVNGVRGPLAVVDAALTLTLVAAVALAARLQRLIVPVAAAGSHAATTTTASSAWVTAVMSSSP